MTITTKDIWDTAAQFGVSYEIAKAILEREERYAAGEEVEAEDARDIDYPERERGWPEPYLPSSFADR